MTGNITTTGEIFAGTAKTDGQMPIALAPGIALSSAVYTATDSSNVAFGIKMRLKMF